MIADTKLSHQTSRWSSLLLLTALAPLLCLPVRGQEKVTTIPSALEGEPRSDQGKTKQDTKPAVEVGEHAKQILLSALVKEGDDSPLSAWLIDRTTNKRTLQ